MKAGYCFGGTYGTTPTGSSRSPRAPDLPLLFIASFIVSVCSGCTRGLGRVTLLRGARGLAASGERVGLRAAGVTLAGLRPGGRADTAGREVTDETDEPL